MLLVAHRTPPSAARCAALADAGARVFEIDVQLCAGHVAVSHWAPLGPPGGLQHDNWRVRWHTRGRRDPVLAEVDSVVPAACSVLLDLKESRPARRRDLLAALAEALPERGRYVVCSPHPDDLERARSAGFGTWRTVGTRRALAELLAGRGEGGARDAGVTVRHSLLDAPTLDRLRSVAGPVVAWTVNDLPRARALRDLGVDGVTTDRVAVLRELAAGPHSESTLLADRE